MKLPRLKHKIRKPKNAAQKRNIAARDFFRRQQFNRIAEVLRYYYTPDTIDDYIEFTTPIDLAVGDEFEFSFLAPASQSDIVNKGYLFIGTTGVNDIGFRPRDDLNVEFTSDSIRVYLDEVEISTLTKVMPVDGEVHQLRIEIIAECTLSYLHSNAGLFDFSNIPIWDLDITRQVGGGLFYAIDDGWDNDPIIAESLQGLDGTAVNFNEANWSLEEE